MSANIVIFECRNKSVGINRIVSQWIINSTFTLNRFQSELTLSTLGYWRQIKVKPTRIDGQNIETINFSELSFNWDTIFVEFLSA